MKALSRKCTAFLLSLTLLLTLGADGASPPKRWATTLTCAQQRSTAAPSSARGTFWSNTFSDLRQENYVVYTPNTSVTPIVTYGDYTTATSTVSAAAKRLEEQGLRVVAGINGDYYDTLNGAPLRHGDDRWRAARRLREQLCRRLPRGRHSHLGALRRWQCRSRAPTRRFPLPPSIRCATLRRHSPLHLRFPTPAAPPAPTLRAYDVVCSAVDGRLSISF